MHLGTWGSPIDQTSHFDSSAEGWPCAQPPPTSLHLTRPRKYAHLLSTNTLNSPANADPRENLTQAEQGRRCTGRLVFLRRRADFSDTLYLGLLICPESVSHSMAQRKDGNRTNGRKPGFQHWWACDLGQLADLVFVPLPLSDPDDFHSLCFPVYPYWREITKSSGHEPWLWCQTSHAFYICYFLTFGQNYVISLSFSFYSY